jgi:hypothetical protein
MFQSHSLRRNRIGRSDQQLSTAVLLNVLVSYLRLAAPVRVFHSRFVTNQVNQ